LVDSNRTDRFAKNDLELVVNHVLLEKSSPCMDEAIVLIVPELQNFPTTLEL
jgi:hypothetical protein